MPQTLHVNSPGTVTIPDPVATIGAATFVPDSAPVNHAPIVNAGADIQITSPLSSVQLNGSATDPDTAGKVTSTNWVIRSGSGTISDTTILNPMVTGLVVGTTVLRLTATDDQGAIGTDDINIVVHDVTPPPTPGYTPIYTNNISSVNDCDPFDHEQWGASTLASHFDTTNFVSPPGSFRSRPANVSSGTRSEIQFDAAQTPLIGAMEWNVRYNYFLKGFCHSAQFHPSSPSGASASPGLWHENGKLSWYNWINGTNTHHTTTFTPVLGQWYRFRIEYAFGSNGYFRFYVDGQLILQWTGQVGNNSQPYFKLGVNAGFDGNTSEAAKSDVNYDSFIVYKFNG